MNMFDSSVNLTKICDVNSSVKFNIRRMFYKSLSTLPCASCADKHIMHRTGQMLAMARHGRFLLQLFHNCLSAFQGSTLFVLAFCMHVMWEVFARAAAPFWQCLSLLLLQLACKCILDTTCKFIDQAHPP